MCLPSMGLIWKAGRKSRSAGRERAFKFWFPTRDRVWEGGGLSGERYWGWSVGLHSSVGDGLSVEEG